jgi:hypothetical protein
MKTDLTTTTAQVALLKRSSLRQLLLMCSVAVMTAVLTSCGGGEVGLPSARQLVSVTIQPNSANATQGNTVPFSATGTFSRAPLTQNNMQAQWASSDTNIATIDPNTGAAMCVSVGGPAIITAWVVGKGGMVNGTAALTCQVSPDPIATLSPQTIGFLCGNQTNSQGQKVCSCKSGGNTVTLTNTGGSNLDISQISAGPSACISDQHSCDFNHQVWETDTCAGTSVAPGQSCTINVDAIWTGTGLFSGSVSVYDSAADSPQKVSVSGITTCN